MLLLSRAEKMQEQRLSIIILYKTHTFLHGFYTFHLECVSLAFRAILSWMTKRNLVLIGPWFMRVKRIEWSWTFTTTFSNFLWRKIWSWGRRRGRALWLWCSRGRQRSWGSWMKRFKEWLWLGDCWPSLISLWCWTGAPRRVSGLKRLSENAIIEIILNFDSL